MDVDHYSVLGLPSGEEGAKLTEKEISKAYKQKALGLHLDKRPDDPNAHENFQNLKSSYEILKDEKARKLFDDLLRVKREQQRFKRKQQLHYEQQDAKCWKIMSDLEEREHAAFAPDPTAKAREEEERISRKLKEEIARIRAMHMNRGASADSGLKKDKGGTERNVGGGVGLANKEKMLKVSWEKVGEDYTTERLRELFSRFGKFEDVVIKNSKNRGYALVVMGSKEAAVTAAGSLSGSLLNPLLVVPLQPTVAAEFSSAKKAEEDNCVNKLVGASYQAYEDAILKKLQMAVKKQK